MGLLVPGNERTKMLKSTNCFSCGIHALSNSLVNTSNVEKKMIYSD